MTQSLPSRGPQVGTETSGDSRAEPGASLSVLEAAQSQGGRKRVEWERLAFSTDTQVSAVCKALSRRSGH